MSFAAQRMAAGFTLADVCKEFRVPLSLATEWDEGKAQPPGHVARSLALIEAFAEQNASEAVLVRTFDKCPPAPPAKRKVARKAEADVPAASLIKSKKRVADHGEVFTPPWLVEKMLDLVKGESERIESRFLEPACGSGNFLVAVLERKLAAVETKYGDQAFNKKQWALQALACCYGIELLEDNIAECRDNMLAVFAEYLGIDESDELCCAARHILSLNLIHGDAMKMTKPDGSPIMIVEWTYLERGKFNRRDFRLSKMVERSGFDERWSPPDTEQKVTLFGEPRPAFHQRGDDEIFKALRDYPLMTVREIAAMDADA